MRSLFSKPWGNLLRNILLPSAILIGSILILMPSKRVDAEVICTDCICHNVANNPHTICPDSDAFPAHLAHIEDQLDTCGKCGACGDGFCDTNEDCVSCPVDCTSCITPSPTPPLTPLPTPPVSCGDHICGAGEDCSNCPEDCGPCNGSIGLEGTTNCSLRVGNGATHHSLFWSLLLFAGAPLIMWQRRKRAQAN